ncbi:MDR family NADP-dependent oxidoreductase [Lentzea guizhouensis]|uniref:MDR family NADP-dependent oxidoreductase n=1 Tax=Lentzea guizhouensis TaxID=1586287 RepID=UPI000B060EC3|nr:NADP-dependent oxidoreductase [Lentzea guizhouensis]
MSIPEKQWEVRLAKHVENDLTLEHFDLVEVAVPEPGDGEVLVRVDYVSVAAAFKEFMRADCQIPGVPPWKLGEPAGAGGVGTVVKSNSPDLAVGDLVQSFGPWQEYWSGPAQQFIKQNPHYVPSPVYFLSQGPTAYYGMATIAQAGEGDVVFVTGAAGGVGSLAGQIAKARGAKVIGSAGSQAKVDWLVNELGFDAAFNYKDGPVADRLRELAPDGISVFFDNVGGAVRGRGPGRPTARAVRVVRRAGQPGRWLGRAPAARPDDGDHEAPGDPPVRLLPPAGADPGLGGPLRTVVAGGEVRVPAHDRRGWREGGSAGVAVAAVRLLHRERDGQVLLSAVILTCASRMVLPSARRTVVIPELTNASPLSTASWLISTVPAGSVISSVIR